METRKTTPRATAIKLLLAIAVGVILFYGHVAFIPVALALLISLILSGPVEYLHCHRVPRALSAALIVAAIFGIMIALVTFMSEPAQKWIAAAPHTVRLIERKIRPFEQVMSRVGELRNSIGNIGSVPPPGQTPATSAAPPAPAPSAPPAAAAGESAPAVLLDSARTVALSLVTITILTLFLLSGGPPMLARMTAAFASDMKAAHILAVIEKVRSEVGRFYVTTAMINVGLGLATSLAMMACGMPNPFLWGTMAAILNFIPYAGATTTLIVLTVVAIISFDGLGHVAAVAGCYLALATIEGQFAQPLLVGRRLQLNPMLVFLALWFGGFFWGIAGIVLATPTLAAIKVVATNSAGGKSLLEFLSPHKQDEPVHNSAVVERGKSVAVVRRQRRAMPPVA